ncbi:MAG TPA: EAL domain-containing protein [Candidatus Atribacteria bacterium]|nr:EAL domain-containing protein [Candidatus Atribacteria bacterium]
MALTGTDPGNHELNETLSRLEQLEKNYNILKENVFHGQQISQLGSWTYDIKRGEMYRSDGMYNILGCKPEELTISFQSYYQHVHPEDLDKVKQADKAAIEGRETDMEYRIITPEGEVRYVHEITKVIFDENGCPARIVGILQNITEKKLLEEALEYRQKHDDLTGLPNREYFTEYFNHVCEASKSVSEPKPFAVILLDLDGFKRINNSLGFNIGDMLITQISARLVSFLGESAFVSRYSGDRFAIILERFDSFEQCRDIVRGVLCLFDRTFKVGLFELEATVSLGISIFPNDGKEPDELLNNADMALLRAKNEGGKRAKFFSRDISRENYRQYSLRKDLLSSIEKNQLRVYYQPVVNLFNGEILAVEALIRWEHPVWGLVSPGEFIHMAEETGFIIPMGKWLLREVCKNYKSWLNEGLPPIKVSVNYSAVQFFENDFVEKIKGIIDEYGLDYRFLIIEITESILLKRTDKTVSDIKKLQALGIRLALDDFGTGFSALSYLSAFDIDILKIDGSFIRNVVTDEANEIIIKSIINMAAELKILLVAEGIETEEQHRHMKMLSCYAGQGYLFARPMPEGDFKAILRQGGLVAMRKFG